MQWVSLVILGCGVVLVQMDPNASSSGKSSNMFVGMISIVVASCTSGFAGVFMEKMFKDSKFSLWSRNVWLALYSILVSVIGILFKNPSLLLPSNFFHGYTFWSWLAVVLLAVGGLIIAMVLKYADNILKAFAGSASILFSTLISYFLFHTELTMNFVVGAILVMISVVLYSYGGRKIGYKPLSTVESKIFPVCKKQIQFSFLNTSFGSSGSVFIP